MWANKSDRSQKMSDHEPIAQVTHQKWATMSKSLRLLTKNEQMSELLVFWANHSFAHFSAKRSNSLRQPMSEFPAWLIDVDAVLSLLWSFFPFTRYGFCTLIVVEPLSLHQVQICCTLIVIVVEPLSLHQVRNLYTHYCGASFLHQVRILYTHCCGAYSLAPGTDSLYSYCCGGYFLAPDTDILYTHCCGASSLACTRYSFSVFSM